MSDTLGGIAVPDPPVIAAFPFAGEYGSGYDFTPPVATHVFNQPGLKTEQRYLLGSGARRFRVTRTRGLACDEYENLQSHWKQAQGSYAQFPYTYTTPGGVITVTCRYENPMVSFDHLVGMLCSDPGITLLEIPGTSPVYTSVKTLERFPDSTLTAALEQQVQQIIPLVTITPRPVPAGPSKLVQFPRTAPVPIYVSNQRCKVDGITFLPRLLDWTGISQTLSEASDASTFTFGNADDVWTQLGNAVNLYRAVVQLQLYHVQSQILVNFWSGYARPWNLTSDGKFVLPASDGVFELSLAYPTRVVSRTCWKVYKGRYCPSTSTLPDCPKSYDACVERGVQQSFGGIVANPVAVHVKDNSTGTLGWGKSMLTSVSIANDSIYQRVVQEVYTDESMTVDCDVAAGRDESDFYSALGIVSEGPIGTYAGNLLLHTLDGAPPHDLYHYGGWRGIIGNDPADTLDFFDLDQAPWNTVPPGAGYAAGLAFAEIRRTDAAGLQLAPVTDRKMQVTVDAGVSGWYWSAPGMRSWRPGLSNCVWVAINVYLRALGLKVQPSNATDIPPDVMEQYFDVNAAIAAANICDLVVDKLVGTGQEAQFPFRGILKEQKPLKDWLQEILNCCLGYYTFVNGKLWIGIRENSSVLAGNSFTDATILYQSLQATPLAPQFNWLTVEFGDEEFLWALNNVGIYDIDAATFAGNGDSPQYTQNTMTLVGVSNKSQAARIATTRLREEIGGVGPDEQRNARNLQFKTTLLAMQTQAGDIISLNSPRLPGGRCEARVQKWQLNPDFSIDITASATTDSMYDLTMGPKPDDAPVEAVPPELLQPPQGLVWMANHVAPLAADPMWPDTKERTFDLWQDYSIQRDGVWSPALFVAGDMVVNRFTQPVQPRITGVKLISGGNINGPLTVYVSITQHDASGLYSYPSNLVALWVPSGTTGQGVQVDMIPAPSGNWTGWDIWAGTDRRSIGLQDSFEQALPATYGMPGFRGDVSHMTQAVPEAAIRKVRIAAKRVWASGIAPCIATDVNAPDQIVCADFIGTSDNWVGRYLSTIGDLSDGSAPLWNFQITGFDSATGTFTVFPQAVLDPPSDDSVQPGDVLVMRSFATAAGPDWVEDAMWNNSVFQNLYGNAGWANDQLVGLVCRVLRGPGQGQIRRISSNTATRIYVDPPWDVQLGTVYPDRSVIIIENPDFDYFSETSDIDAPRSGKPIQIRMGVDNLADLVALVVGYAVDDQGNITDEELACYREIYIFGEPPAVRVVGPGAGPWQALVTDQTLRADTSANDITIQLLPLANYQGRQMYVVNDGTHNVIVQTVTDETFWDGSATITGAPGETLTITAG